MSERAILQPWQGKSRSGSRKLLGKTPVFSNSGSRQYSPGSRQFATATQRLAYNDAIR